MKKTEITAEIITQSKGSPIRRINSAGFRSIEIFDKINRIVRRAIADEWKVTHTQSPTAARLTRTEFPFYPEHEIRFEKKADWFQLFVFERRRRKCRVTVELYTPCIGKQKSTDMSLELALSLVRDDVCEYTISPETRKEGNQLYDQLRTN
jgi:hypothetical protein